jgi:hypothetical protein
VTYYITYFHPTFNSSSVLYPDVSSYQIYNLLSKLSFRKMDMEHMAHVNSGGSCDLPEDCFLKSQRRETRNFVQYRQFPAGIGLG